MWQPTVSYTLYIGIDPGLNTGVAIYSKPNKTLLLVKTLSFWDAIEELERQCAGNEENICAVIEDPTANRPTFEKKGATESERKKREKISQNVGSNKRDAQLVIEWFERRKIAVIKRKPSKFTRKIDEAEFLKVTGHGKCSQHARDASMLVFGL